MLDAEIVAAVGETTGQIGQHTRVTAQQQIVYGRKKFIADFADHNMLVLLLLHANDDDNGSQKADDLAIM